LHAAGRRFRVSYPVPGLNRCSIDIAFPRQRVAVFVDGCFWHGCTAHGTEPTSNAARWAAKLEANRARDARVNAHLLDRGWRVLRVWEHEDTASACERVLQALAAPTGMAL
jgi:DNA mismatch endonuclease (patch repair protein)